MRCASFMVSIVFPGEAVCGIVSDIFRDRRQHRATSNGGGSMKLTLYYAPQTCALVPYVTLTEAGADFDVQNINTRNGQNRTPEFLKVNPKHKVPVLVIDGEPLTENIAIQIWINRHFPRARLLPADPQEEIRAISL